MNKLIKHIEWALAQAYLSESKIDERILEMPGMSGSKTRHFYNNICSMDDARYLEIGAWKGSSLCSAMYDNEMTCVAIDNWSESPFEDFLQNFNRFKGGNNASFIEKNCWDVDASTIGKFNIYMYDACHTEESHHKALSHYFSCLDDEFIYLVDDWNVKEIQDGTLSSIKDNKLEVLYQKEIFSPGNNHIYPFDWHNGISIFVLKKQ